MNTTNSTKILELSFDENGNEIVILARNEFDRLEAENERQREALDAVWEALDGLYGADSGEELPIDLLPEDRQQLFHKALELVGGTLNREQAKWMK